MKDLYEYFFQFVYTIRSDTKESPSVDEEHRNVCLSLFWPVDARIVEEIKVIVQGEVTCGVFVGLSAPDETALGDRVTEINQR